MSVSLRVPLGTASDLVAGGDARLVAVEGPEPYRSIVVFRDDAGVRAYWNVCAHLPVPLDAGDGEVEIEWDGHLVCKTHGARYRPVDGYCVEGPCLGELLKTVDIVDEAGTLYGIVGDDSGPVDVD